MNLAPGVIVPIPTLPLSLTLRPGFIGSVPSLSTLNAGAPASPTTISLAPGVAVPTPTFWAVMYPDIKSIRDIAKYLLEINKFFIDIFFY